MEKEQDSYLSNGTQKNIGAQQQVLLACMTQSRSTYWILVYMVSHVSDVANKHVGSTDLRVYIKGICDSRNFATRFILCNYILDKQRLLPTK